MQLAQQFESLWYNSEAPPDLFEFLAAHPRLPAATQAQIVLIDQARRWQHGVELKVEDYLERLPALNRDVESKLQLVLAEFQHCLEVEPKQSIEEFTSRFKDLGVELRQKLSELVSSTEAQQDPSTTVAHFVEQESKYYRKENSERNSASTELAASNKGARDPVNAIANTGIRPKERIGRYRIQKTLDHDQVSTLYLVYDEELERNVTLRIANSDAVHEAVAEEILASFRLLASLDHPNILPVYDARSTSSGSWYVVSKHIEGVTLAAHVKSAPPSHAEAAELIAKIALALDYAHSKNLIHGNVNPKNILLEAPDGVPYIADFGFNCASENWGDDNRLLETSSCLSPEQVLSESHLLDRRTDIFSLGAVLYELLTGACPFDGSSVEELRHQIVAIEPRNPSEANTSVPYELERICLKALAKSQSDRYPTAAELASDLLQSMGSNIQRSRESHVVPKGLRCFDAEDSDFFASLLPGPRNRHGLPETVAFWKNKIETTTPEDTFRIGLIYGPSGCGKSSLFRAGVIPNLPDEIKPIYVESTQKETEFRLLTQLHQAIPELANRSEPDKGLTATLTEIRRGTDHRIVVVLDQFEQWLSANQANRETELVNALRQADGTQIQVIALIRDDFVMPALRFMDLLDAPVVQGQNLATVDLFDEDHARQVLIKFGRAYGKLPNPPERLDKDQEQFVHSTISELSIDQKVISVRLALFAEMIKDAAWNSSTLQRLGGTEGIGVRFLEETFGSRSTNPKYLLHAEAAKRVLAALLPGAASAIKGGMRTETELMLAAGYSQDRQKFIELLQILDDALRLITPTDGQSDAGDKADSSRKHASQTAYFQLTHDYLVPSLRTWLTRQQQSSRTGRAELLLEERSDLWNSKPEDRHLPTLLEWATIRTLTIQEKWTEPQRAMMERASTLTRRKGSLACLAGVLLTIIAMFAVARVNENQNARTAKALVDSLLSARTTEIGETLEELGQYRRWAKPLLQQVIAENAEIPVNQRHARVFLLTEDPRHAAPLFEQSLAASVEDFPVLVSYLNPHQKMVKSHLVAKIREGNHSQRLRAAAAASLFKMASALTPEQNEEVVTAMLQAPPSESDDWIRMLSGLGTELSGSLERRFLENVTQPASATRPAIAKALAAYCHDDPERLTTLLLTADNSGEFKPLLDAIRPNGPKVIPRLINLLKKDGDPTKQVELWHRQANAAITLFELGASEHFLPSLKLTPNPSLRSIIIPRFSVLGANTDTIATLITQEPDPDIRYALTLALGHFSPDNLTASQRQKLYHQVSLIYLEDPHPGVHSAATWTLRNWGQPEPDIGLPTEFSPTKQWYLNSQGQTMALFRGPLESTRTSWDNSDGQPKQVTEPANLLHSFSISTHEVTLEQFRRFRLNHLTDDRFTSPNAEPKKPEESASHVSFSLAALYCNWLNRQEGVPVDQWCYQPSYSGAYMTEISHCEDVASRTGYRLPTDVELEFASRGGTITTYSFGEPIELLKDYSWFVDSSESHVWPPGLKLPNSLGFFDVHGNLEEWCHNKREFSDHRSIPPTKNLMRPYSGGTFMDDAQRVQSASFGASPSGGFGYRNGFRIARTISWR